jgi:hypothetical protein
MYRTSHLGSDRVRHLAKALDQVLKHTQHALIGVGVGRAKGERELGAAILQECL